MSSKIKVDIFRVFNKDLPFTDSQGYYRGIINNLKTIINNIDNKESERNDYIYNTETLLNIINYKKINDLYFFQFIKFANPDDIGLIDKNRDQIISADALLQNNSKFVFVSYFAIKENSSLLLQTFNHRHVRFSALSTYINEFHSKIKINLKEEFFTYDIEDLIKSKTIQRLDVSFTKLKSNNKSDLLDVNSNPPGFLQAGKTMDKHDASNFGFYMSTSRNIGSLSLAGIKDQLKQLSQSNIIKNIKVNTDEDGNIDIFHNRYRKEYDKQIDYNDFNFDNNISILSKAFRQVEEEIDTQN